MGCKRDKTVERSLDGQRNKCCTTSGGAVISKGGSRRESVMAKSMERKQRSEESFVDTVALPSLFFLCC